MMHNGKPGCMKQDVVEYQHQNWKQVTDPGASDLQGLRMRPNGRE
jgi:hypothetical protein